MAIKYKWLCDKLKELIREDIYKGINKLPGEEHLAAKYKVSRQTVRQSLALLEAEGLIEKRHGSGSYITGLLSEEGHNRIALLVTNAEDYLYPALLYDIKKELSDKHFTVEIFVTENSVAKERLLLEKLCLGNYRGCIVEGSKSALPNPNIDLYRKLAALGTQLVFLHNCYDELTDFPCIMDANSQGATMLVRHLAAQGHHAIACIFQVDEVQGRERFRGFTESMRDLSFPIQDSLLHWFGAFDLIGLEQRDDTAFLGKIAAEIAHSCTAVVCHNDEIAYWLATEFKKLGIRVPEDVAIASFDNTYLSSTSALSLTTLTHEPHQMAHLVATAMIDKCKGLPVESQTVPWTLLTRRST